MSNYINDDYIFPDYIDPITPTDNEWCYSEDYALKKYFECFQEDIIVPDIPEPVAFRAVRKSPGVIFGKKKSLNKSNSPLVTSLVGYFEKGEPNEPTFIENMEDFIDVFGNENSQDVVSAGSFFLNANHLLVTRCCGENTFNASSPGYGSIRIDNYVDFTEQRDDIFSNLNESKIRFIARTPGKQGNNIRIAMFTKVEHDFNIKIYRNLRAKDIIQNMELNVFCIVVFRGNIVSEVSTIPYDSIEDLNTKSKEFYVVAKDFEMVDSLFDGNRGFFDGNEHFYDPNYDQNDLHDGNDEEFDGNQGVYDGNLPRSHSELVKYFGDSMLALDGGVTQKPSSTDYRDCANILENINDWYIDFNIGNHVTLNRQDCVNFVTTPFGIETAIDFVQTFGMRINESEYFNHDYDKKVDKDNILFLYGFKKLNKIFYNLNGDYVGIRCREILNNGIGTSNSKITTPLPVNNIRHILNVEEIDELWEEGINAIVKNKNTIYCNSEKLITNSLGKNYE